MKIISVIIPFYNAEKFLEKCVSSFKTKYPDKIELILINDGSIDSSWNIANELSKKNTIDIILINKTNTGPSESRNIGMKKASGQYICFMDSDDYVTPQFIDNILLEIENKKPDIIFVPFMSINEKGEIISNNKLTLNVSKSSKAYIISNLITNDIFGYSGTKCFLKSIVDENKIEMPIKLKICEDLLFTCEVVKKVSRINVLSEPQYFYLINQNSLSRKFRIEMFEEYEYVNKKYFKFLIDEDICNKEEIICEKAVQTIVTYLRMTKHYDKDKVSIDKRCKWIINCYTFKILKEYKKYFLTYVTGNKKYPLFSAILIDNFKVLKLLLKFV